MPPTSPPPSSFLRIGQRFQTHSPPGRDWNVEEDTVSAQSRTDGIGGGPCVCVCVCVPRLKRAAEYVDSDGASEVRRRDGRDLRQLVMRDGVASVAQISLTHAGGDDRDGGAGAAGPQPGVPPPPAAAAAAAVVFAGRCGLGVPPAPPQLLAPPRRDRLRDRGERVQRGGGQRRRPGRRRRRRRRRRRGWKCKKERWVQSPSANTITL